MPVDAGADIRPLRTLRLRTLTAHRELEDHLELMSPQLDLGRYGRLLQGFASVYGALEPRLDDELDRHRRDPGVAELDIGSRWKLPALRADLGALGLAGHEPVEPPVVDSLPAAIGALYVTEGATLGGVLISRHLVHRFGPNVPHAFFRSYGHDVPARWATYRRVAGDVLRATADVDVATTTAVATFATYQRVLVP